MGFASGRIARVVVIFVFVMVVLQSAHAALPYRMQKEELLSLEKAQLGTEQLLRASLIVQGQASTGEGALSRVIRFERRADRIYMMEAERGHTVTGDLPTALILAEFPILSETTKRVVIDFNAGMRRIFSAENFHVSDFDGRTYNTDNRSMGVDVVNSFIKEHGEYLDGRPGGGELLSISQVVQVVFSNGLYQPTYEVRYYLSPYTPAENFSVRENPPGMREYGFFETAPVLQSVSGRSRVATARWNIASGPVVYHISANTPPEYVDAVREGILYWNKAFGAEVLKVEIAPEGITAPHPHYNIVQWVPWDGAGFAYADALLDPHTGEIMNAQVFLTSVFAFDTKEQVRKLLRLVYAGLNSEEPLSEGESFAGDEAEDFSEDEDDDFEDGEDAQMSRTLRRARAQLLSVLPQAASSRRDRSRGRTYGRHSGRRTTHAHGCSHGSCTKGPLKPKHLCSLDFKRHSLQALEGALSDKNITNEALGRLSKDLIRTIVAHEVGHTLGLRHNFAGKLASNITISQREELFANYMLAEQEIPEEVSLTSSVMDYVVLKDNVLLGQLIAKRPEAMAHDTIAIRAGYGLMEQDEVRKMSEAGSLPLFCTDSGVGVYGDCVPFARGANPIASNLYEMLSTAKGISNYVLEGFLNAKAPVDPQDRRSFGELQFSADEANGYAFHMAMQFAQQLSWLSASQKSLVVERMLSGQPVQSDQSTVHTVQYKLVTSGIESVGGIGNALFSLVPEAHESGDEAEAGAGAQSKRKSVSQLASAHLEKLLTAMVAGGFEGADGQHYDLSAEEAAHIRAVAASFAAQVEKTYRLYVLYILALIPADLELAAQDGFVMEDGLTSKLEEYVSTLAGTTILADDEAGRALTGAVQFGPQLTPQLMVQMRKYSQFTRWLAARAINHRVGASSDWGMAARVGIAQILKQEIESALGQRIQNIRPTRMESMLRQWFVQESSILEALISGGPGCEELLKPEKKRPGRGGPDGDGGMDDGDDDARSGDGGRRRLSYFRR